MAETYTASIAVKSKSDAYSVAKEKTRKAKAIFDETSSTSKNYASALQAYNKAKQEEANALKEYQDLYNKEKKAFEAKKKAESTAKRSQSLEAKLRTLKDDLQRAKDSNQSTTQIEAAIKKTQDEINKTKVVADNRPAGVPSDAKFNTVTGNWESGNLKWDKNGQAVTTTKAPPKTPSKTPSKTTATDAGTDVTGVNTDQMGAVGRGEYGPSKAAPITGATIDEIFAKAASIYGGIDEIFKTNPELKALLTRAVGNINDPLDDYQEKRFISELENTNWFKENAGPIRQRGFYERQYNELVKGLKTDSPDYQAKIAELNKTSEYGRGLQDTVDKVKEYVTQYLGINALDDVTINSIAQDLYRYANETDGVKIRNAVLAAAKYGPTTTTGGATGQNLTTLKAIAAANGFDLQKTFGNSIPTWLDNMNKGESIETYKKVIRDAAKTAFNVSDRVAALLDQGVDLDTIYSPYKNLMASTLELNPSDVSLKDIANYGVIGNKDQMNLYDFQRALRKDSRWQYTANAAQDVSNSVLGVLRDFGFQG